jgi:hypothetical protein
VSVLGSYLLLSCIAEEQPQEVAGEVEEVVEVRKYIQSVYFGHSRCCTDCAHLSLLVGVKVVLA